MSVEDGMSGAETAAAVIGSLACLGMAVGGGYCLVKCLKWCLLPTPNTPDLEAPKTPEEAAGPLQTIKALLEPVLRTKVQEEPTVDPVDPLDQVDQVDTISQASTASYKSIVD